jgi:hypothetical protein
MSGAAHRLAGLANRARNLIESAAAVAAPFGLGAVLIPNHAPSVGIARHYPRSGHRTTARSVLAVAYKVTDLLRLWSCRFGGSFAETPAVSSSARRPDVGQRASLVFPGSADELTVA